MMQATSDINNDDDNRHSNNNQTPTKKGSLSSPSPIVTTRSRRATHDLYLALLAIVAIAVVQMFLHEATYLGDHMEHLNSPHNLDLNRFKQELVQEVKDVGVHVVDEMLDLTRVEHHKTTHLRANQEGAPQISTSRHGTRHVHVPAKQHTLDLLDKAGVDLTDLDEESIRQLPTLNEIEGMYGSGVFIGGLDRCTEFQMTVAQEDAFIGPAGIFNTVRFSTMTYAEMLDLYISPVLVHYCFIREPISWLSI